MPQNGQRVPRMRVRYQEIIYMTNKKDLEFLRVTHLRGPNIWTYRPVIEVVVDIGALEDAPSNKIPGLYERLVAWRPVSSSRSSQAFSVDGIE